VKWKLIVLSACACLGTVAAASQDSPRPLAIEVLGGEALPLTVISRSFDADGTIPPTYSDYGEKISPELSWSGVPASAKSLVLLMEDPDARQPKPFVHWVLYNLPASISSLPESIPGTPRLPDFGGALQGRNSHGTIGYFGPRPPKGDPAHHYHFQLFALDSTLGLEAGASPAAVLSALKGHVVAHGEIVGLFRSH
jgi:Raf kinase inhibitor-like YbhB/YbcL family protein